MNETSRESAEIKVQAYEQWKVERKDAADGAHRLAHHAAREQRIADINALNLIGKAVGERGKVLEARCRVGDIKLGFGDRLAVVLRLEPRQRRLVLCRSRGYFLNHLRVNVSSERVERSGGRQSAPVILAASARNTLARTPAGVADLAPSR